MLRTPHMLRTLRTAFLLLACWLLLAVVSCGGGDGAEVAAGEVELASADELTAFRYEMVMELSAGSGSGSGGGGLSMDLNFTMEFAGAVIPPDREQSTIKADLGFVKIEMETIRVGDRSWTREPGGDWEDAAAAGGDMLPLDLSISPLDLLGGSEFTSLQVLFFSVSGATESVNGVSAVRYELTAEQFAQAFPSDDAGDALPTGELEGMTVALWITRDSGIPVRLIIEGTTTEEDGGGSVRIELNLTDLNSSSIEIEPPA